MTLILWQASGVSEIVDSQVDSGGLPLSLKCSGPNIYCKHHDHHVLLYICVYSPDCVPIPIVTGHPQTIGVSSVKRLVDPLAVVWHFHYAELRIPGSWRSGRPSKGVQDVMSFTTSEFRMGVCWQYVYNMCTIEYVFLARGYSMRICNNMYNKWEVGSSYWMVLNVAICWSRPAPRDPTIMEVWMGITDNWYDLKYQSISAIYRLYIGYICTGTGKTSKLHIYWKVQLNRVRLGWGWCSSHCWWLDHSSTRRGLRATVTLQ